MGKIVATPTGNVRIGIACPDPDVTRRRCEDGSGTGRRSPGMIAGFEGHHHGVDAMERTIGAAERDGERFGVVTPSNLNRPSLTWGSVETGLPKVKCTRPATVSVSAAGTPLKGMCTTSI